MNREQALIRCANNYLGCIEGDTQYKRMLEIYNNNNPLPRGYRVQPKDAWGCIFVSTMAIMSRLKDVIPIECSCYEQMTLFKKMGLFRIDKCKPKIGDFVYFSWEQDEFPTQVGIVKNFKDETIRIIMGNVSIFAGGVGVVNKRIKINSNYIVGYASPQY